MATIDSIQERAQQDLAALIAALDLPAYAPTMPAVPTVYVESTYDESNITYPCILVTCDGQREEEGPRTNFRDDNVIYHVAIAIMDRTTVRYQDARPVYESWRRSILRMLRGLVEAPILPNTPECFDVRVSPDVVFDFERGRKYAHLQSGLTVLCHTSEARQET